MSARAEPRTTRDVDLAIAVQNDEQAEHLVFDLQGRGYESEIVAESEPIAILEDLTLNVATRAHLIALKVLARDERNRPQDWDDLRALLRDA